MRSKLEAIADIRRVLDRAIGDERNRPLLCCRGSQMNGACPLTHVPPDLWSRNPAPPRVSWTWMNPKRYARCTAAEVSDWSVSTLPLRSIGVSVLASTGGDDTDTARPDAWCRECEPALRALDGASSEQWFRNARFKIFCAKCWDEAKLVCSGLPKS